MELQENWNLLGESVFLFQILEIGTNPWADSIIRLQGERKHIQINKDCLYNKNGLVVKKSGQESRSPHCIPVIISGKKFNSIGAAANQYNVSLSTMRAGLNDPTKPNWCYEDLSRRAVSNVARAVVVDGKVFLSVSLAAGNHSITEKTVRASIKNKPNWSYFDTLTTTEQEKLQAENGELVLGGSFLSGKRVNADGLIFPSM